MCSNFVFSLSYAWKIIWFQWTFFIISDPLYLCKWIRNNCHEHCQFWYYLWPAPVSRWSCQPVYAKLLSLVTKALMEVIINAYLFLFRSFQFSFYMFISKRLWSVQKAASQHLTRHKGSSHVTPNIISPAFRLPVKVHIHFKILVLAFRALHVPNPLLISSPSFLIRLIGHSGCLTVTRRHKVTVVFKLLFPNYRILPLSVRLLDSCQTLMKQLKLFLFRFPSANSFWTTAVLPSYCC